ncbi:MAG: ABC transporter ATP-binding protein, partial [Anaerolineae bacterium]
RSLAPGPRLLMLDEPLGSLDRALRERLMLDLRAILKRVGVTAIYVTHDQAEAFAIADRVAVMNAGRVEQLDAPQRIFARPATPFVARFLGFQNLLAGTVAEGETVVTPIGRLRASPPLPPAGTPVTVLIKPDAARLSAAGQDTRIEGTITAVSFRGAYFQLWLESGGESLLFEGRPAENRQAGQRVGLSVAAAGVMVIQPPG